MKALIETMLSIILLFVVTPWLIVFAKKKKLARALGGGLYIAFNMLDPAMSRALERIEVHQVIGNSEDGDQGDLHDPPQARASLGSVDKFRPDVGSCQLSAQQWSKDP